MDFARQTGRLATEQARHAADAELFFSECAAVVKMAFGSTVCVGNEPVPCAGAGTCWRQSWRGRRPAQHSSRRWKDVSPILTAAVDRSDQASRGTSYGGPISEEAYVPQPGSGDSFSTLPFCSCRPRRSMTHPRVRRLDRAWARSFACRVPCSSLIGYAAGIMLAEFVPIGKPSCSGDSPSTQFPRCRATAVRRVGLTRSRRDQRRSTRWSKRAFWLQSTSERCWLVRNFAIYPKLRIVGGLGAVC